MVGKINRIFYMNQRQIEKNNRGTPKCLRRKLEIVVIRVNRFGCLVNSKPCSSCLYYLLLYGVKNIYYSQDDGGMIKEKIAEVETSHKSIGHRNLFKYLE